MSLFKSKAQKQAKAANKAAESKVVNACLLYTSPSPRD